MNITLDQERRTQIGDFLKVSSNLAYSDLYLEITSRDYDDYGSYLVADGKHFKYYDIQEIITREDLIKSNPEYAL